MTRPALSLSAVLEVVALELGRRSVAAEDRLVEDLGARSMDLAAIAAALEDRFGVVLEDRHLGEVCRAEDFYRLAVGQAPP